MTKQPSHSGERPMTEAAPDSGEQPFDPSHFGKHEFPAGLREELIKAEKPRIDPKFFQDTVPPHRKPVLTEAEQPVTTPRGGFAAPKQQGTVDREAPTIVAVPKQQANIADRDAPTLVKLPTVKAPRAAQSNAADSPSAPPVDTSRSDPTIFLPATRRKQDNRRLVIGVVAGLVLLIVVALLIRPTPDVGPATAAPSPKPRENTATVEAPQPAAPVPAAPVATENKDAVVPVPSAPSPSGETAVKKKTSGASKPQPVVKPAPASPKARPGFDPSKPWEED